MNAKTYPRRSVVSAGDYFYRKGRWGFRKRTQRNRWHRMMYLNPNSAIGKNPTIRDNLRYLREIIFTAKGTEVLAKDTKKPVAQNDVLKPRFSDRKNPTIRDNLQYLREIIFTAKGAEIFAKDAKKPVAQNDVLKPRFSDWKKPNNPR